jgi:hypothetical protein
MSDQHSAHGRNEIRIWKTLLFVFVLILVAGIFFSFRASVAGAVVRFFLYLVWSLDVFGRVIPEQGLWVGLLILILYIAVGSFYGKSSKVEKSRMDTTPAKGQVEAMAEWVEGRRRGVYFKWQIASLLGGIHQAIQNHRGIGGSEPPNEEVRAYLDAGINSSYADYPSPGLFEKAQPTPFDVELEQVVEYLEEQMEINHDK